VERFATRLEQLVVDGPAAAATSDVPDARARKDVRSVVVGVRKVVHQRRVLRGVVAARYAVAHEPARLLENADVVDAVLERDVDRGPVERLPEVAADLLERVELGKLREPVRIRRRPEHRPGSLVPTLDRLRILA